MRKNILAFDFGGTKLASAIVNIETGNILGYLRANVEEGWEATDLINKMIDVGKFLIADVKNVHIEGIGISFGGPISLDRKNVIKSQHIRGWNNIPLVGIIEEEFNLPTFLENDANLAALGEWKFGAGIGAKLLFYIQISTGVGAGIINNGEIFRGCGLAGEFGHITIKNNGLLCACGKKGCLESYLAGWAIRSQALDEIKNNPKDSIIYELSKSNKGSIDAEIVFQAYRKNDAIAKRIISNAMESLGIAISHAICLFDPDKIVIGGGISKAKDIIKKEMFPVVYSNTPPDFKNRYEIKFSELNGNETLIGAALLAK